MKLTLQQLVTLSHTVLEERDRDILFTNTARMLLPVLRGLTKPELETLLGEQADSWELVFPHRGTAIEFTPEGTNALKPIRERRREREVRKDNTKAVRDSDRQATDG